MLSPAETSLATLADLEALLLLMSGYQDFCAIPVADRANTRAFFSTVITTPEEGFIIVARVDRTIVGFATGYITRSGYLLRRLVHLGDLFVVPEMRGLGVGRTLIGAVSAHARTLGLTTIRWLTSPTNSEAHRLFDRTGAQRSEHWLYVLTQSSED